MTLAYQLGSELLMVWDIKFSLVVQVLASVFTVGQGYIRVSGSSTVQSLQDRFHVQVGLIGAFHQGFDIQGQAYYLVVWVFLVRESDLFI